MEISAKQYGIVSDGIFSTRFPKISRLEPKRPNTIFVPANKLRERFHGLVLAKQINSEKGSMASLNFLQILSKKTENEDEKNI